MFQYVLGKNNSEKTYKLYKNYVVGCRVQVDVGNGLEKFVLVYFLIVKLIPRFNNQ